MFHVYNPSIQEGEANLGYIMRLYLKHKKAVIFLLKHTQPHVSMTTNLI